MSYEEKMTEQEEDAIAYSEWHKEYIKETLIKQAKQSVIDYYNGPIYAFERDFGKDKE